MDENNLEKGNELNNEIIATKDILKRLSYRPDTRKIKVFFKDCRLCWQPEECIKGTEYKFFNDDELAMLIEKSLKNRLELIEEEFKCL